MSARCAAQLRWTPAMVLVLLAAPCVAAERAPYKSPRSTIEATSVTPIGPTDAELDARYGAARKAAEQREREWDRKMKQLAKDVCTGC